MSEFTRLQFGALIINRKTPPAGKLFKIIVFKFQSVKDYPPLTGMNIIQKNTVEDQQRHHIILIT